VVTRKEFEKRLWPGDTFVDFDHSLNTAIKKVRLALGDDNRQDGLGARQTTRGIVTSPGGYS